jgi:hypothetical protein
MNTELTGFFELESGEILWIVHREIPMPKPEPVTLSRDAIKTIMEGSGGEKLTIMLIGKSVSVIVRTFMNPQSIADAIRSEVAAIDSTLPVVLESMSQRVNISRLSLLKSLGDGNERYQGNSEMQHANKRKIGARGFEPPPPWSRTRFQVVEVCRNVWILML